MDPITIALVTASVAALTRSFGSIIKSLINSAVSKDKSISIKFQTKDGTYVEITGNLNDPQKIENLIKTLNSINSGSESPKEVKIEL